jgi:hypothetical protein
MISLDGRIFASLINLTNNGLCSGDYGSIARPIYSMIANRAEDFFFAKALQIPVNVM